MQTAGQHQPLHAGILLSALVLSLSTGFASAILLGLALGDVVPIGRWWTAVVQAHGHAQLFGWTALFILGIGFFFLPRMRGSPLQRAALVPWIGAGIAGGVALRFASQIGLAAGGPRALGCLFGLSGILEAAGAALAIVVLVATLKRGPPIRSRAGMPRILPFLAPAFLSFALASFITAGLTLSAALDGATEVSPRGDRLVVELLLHGFAVPIALAISVQTLPLFLRLPATRTIVVQVAGAAYLAAFLLRAVGTAASAPAFSDAGTVASAIVVIAFVFWLDVVFRMRAPWTTKRDQEYALGARAPMRPGMPDRGEYGRFEWLVRGAYAWLLVGSLLELLAATARLFDVAPLVPPDAGRHALTMGFVTLLIGGMAVRMIPGFVKRPLPAPRVVALLALLGHAAALARVVPLVFPAVPGARAALALSGVLAWTFVLVLALLLRSLLRFRQPLPA